MGCVVSGVRTNLLFHSHAILHPIPAAVSQSVSHTRGQGGNQGCNGGEGAVFHKNIMAPSEKKVSFTSYQCFPFIRPSANRF